MMIAMVPTPLLYFSLFELPVDGGIEITASHNASEYNGFKICIGRESIYGDAITPSGLVPLAARRAPTGVAGSFGDVQGGLVSYSADVVIGFELCGASADSCRFVAGRVEGTRVVLPVAVSWTSPPSRVRFCWGACPLCNLSDGSGLPAGPFELPIE